MEDKNFVCECGDHYLELQPTSKEYAHWVSIDEYNRLVKENEQLLEYIRNKEASSIVDKILLERKK
jgi:hypothetical protein